MTVREFYRSAQWQKLRQLLMMERVTANGDLMCARCGKPILKPYDCIGHHIIALTDANVNDYNISLNPDNIELIHFACHNKEHGRFEGFERRVYLVYGSPCAGKSTFVRESANDDDLIVDFDRLWEAICFSPRENKPPRLKRNAFALRDCLIEQIVIRAGNWRNAFVIGGYPLRTERDMLCDKLRAEPVFIDTDKETCLSRCKTDEWKRYVEDWFDVYTA